MGQPCGVGIQGNVSDSQTARTLARRRHEVILSELRRRGTIRVTELSAMLGVSDMTVRRDLDALDAAGNLEKVHGGAVLTREMSSNEPGFAAKSQLNLPEKHSIALAAAAMIQPGAAIGITAGTTTWQLAPHLVDVPDLTVVTNSVRVADVLHEGGRRDHTVVLTGGVRTPSDALVGPVATTALRSLRLDLVFMGVHGISERSGFSTPNLLEAETNRVFVEAGDQLVVLADHTKWNVSGLSTIAPLQSADTLITDERMPPVARSLLEDVVSNVVYTEPFSRDPAGDIASQRRA
jgi:DeoR/GlpR family transcriptional regulator of sugar metabolism